MPYRQLQSDYALDGRFELVERDAWLDLFAAAPDECSRRLGINWRKVGEIGLVASREVALVEFNRAMCIGAAMRATDAELDEALAWLRSNGATGWAMQVSPAAHTIDVIEWLHDRAMTPLGAGWTKFKFEGSHPAHQPAAGIHIRRVDAKHARPFGRIAEAGFGLPSPSAEWLAALAGRPGWHLYLAYDGELPVACAAAYWHHGVAWFGIDATLADHRRRGAQTALIRQRIEDARAARLTGFTAETVQPLSGKATSYNNYRRAGFAPSYVRPNYKPYPCEDVQF